MQATDGVIETFNVSERGSEKDIQDFISRWQQYFNYSEEDSKSVDDVTYLEFPNELQDIGLPNVSSIEGVELDLDRLLHFPYNFKDPNRSKAYIAQRSKLMASAQHIQAQLNLRGLLGRKKYALEAYSELIRSNMQLDSDTRSFRLINYYGTPLIIKLDLKGEASVEMIPEHIRMMIDLGIPPTTDFEQNLMTDKYSEFGRLYRVEYSLVVALIRKPNTNLVDDPYTLFLRSLVENNDLIANQIKLYDIKIDKGEKVDDTYMNDLYKWFEIWDNFMSGKKGGNYNYEELYAKVYGLNPSNQEKTLRENTFAVMNLFENGFEDANFLSEMHKVMCRGLLPTHLLGKPRTVEVSFGHRHNKVGYLEIIDRLNSGVLNPAIDLIEKKEQISARRYAINVASLMIELIKIHPFPDGNGRVVIMFGEYLMRQHERIVPLTLLQLTERDFQRRAMHVLRYPIVQAWFAFLYRKDI